MVLETWRARGRPRASSPLSAAAGPLHPAPPRAAASLRRHPLFNHGRSPALYAEEVVRAPRNFRYVQALLRVASPPFVLSLDIVLRLRAEPLPLHLGLDLWPRA